MPVLDGESIAPSVAAHVTELPDNGVKSAVDNKDMTQQVVASRVATNIEIKPKTYLERMALVTPTDESLLPHLWQPIETLFTFPAVTYAAITYGSTLAWFAMMTSLQATYMLIPPYNFDAIGIGLMNVAPFVGAVLGFPFGGYLSDKSIMWLSKKNGGIYEPEQRLWLALPTAILGPASILLFGLGLAYVGYNTVLLRISAELMTFRESTGLVSPSASVCLDLHWLRSAVSHFPTSWIATRM